MLNRQHFTGYRRHHCFCFVLPTIQNRKVSRLIGSLIQLDIITQGCSCVWLSSYFSTTPSRTFTLMSRSHWLHHLCVVNAVGRIDCFEWIIYVRPSSVRKVLNMSKCKSQHVHILDVTAVHYQAESKAG